MKNLIVRNPIYQILVRRMALPSLFVVVLTLLTITLLTLFIHSASSQSAPATSAVASTTPLSTTAQRLTKKIKQSTHTTKRLISPIRKTKALSSAQKAFINTLLPKIKIVNSRISYNRNRLITLMNQVDNHKILSTKNRAWLVQLAKRYKIKSSVIKAFDNADNAKNLNRSDEQNKQSITKSTLYYQLLNRVGTIPAPLVLAQAANESAWGRSRFAKEGNNYFGQWCSKPGCGLVPRRRAKGSRYEVRKFNSAEGSIASYIHNLNTHRAYASLRKIREENQSTSNPAISLQLATGLHAYSQRGEAYIRSIQNIITRYQLAALVQQAHG